MANLPPSHHPGPGGFLPSQTLPSPGPSSPLSGPASRLPHPRGSALHPGSNKEELVRRWASQQLMRITRRYVRKFALEEEAAAAADDELRGYTTFADLCKDTDNVVNVLWLSGTPSLQVPFLLNIASEFSTYMAAFPPSPHATFAVLRKLDHCFASLLTGEDVKTREPLPGFESGLRAGLTTTDMIRCRSIVQQTRVEVVKLLAREPEPEAPSRDDSAAESGTDGGAVPGFRVFGETDDDLDDAEDDDEELLMDVAKVYEKTIVQLNRSLGVSGPLGDVEMGSADGDDLNDENDDEY